VTSDLNLLRRLIDQSLQPQNSATESRRLLYVLDMTERDGKLCAPEIDILVNDLSLPLWAAIPPRAAARIAVETAEALDNWLESFPPALLEEIYMHYERWVERALHRGEHLDEIEAALRS
jgi:hypothetical protein